MDFSHILSHFLNEGADACYSPRMSVLDTLNDRQQTAVLHTEGPLLIIAGAGAGKTKTITHRIAHLIEKGTHAYRILALTFTNKAAGEMRERVRKLVPAGRGVPLISTFHSRGVRILREFAGRAGIERNFSIWDHDDSLRALKRILDTKDDSLAPRAALSRISREKGAGITVEAFEKAARNFRERDIARAWQQYENALHEEGALDFDDLLVRTLRLLQNSHDVLSLLQERWTHLTIDEYQDTNFVQYEIARLLAGARMNICVVGDIDQNIYSWRGADIGHMLQFEHAFPNTAVVTLEQNYRSTRTILAAANSVIEKNIRRKPKNLFTEGEIGEPILLYGAQNEVDEAWFVAGAATKLTERGVMPSEIAVLYRENFQSRVLEEACLHMGVPYLVLGTRFFERKEVKDLLSYLRASLNPKNRTDLIRIAGVPARGIGRVTIEKMLAGQGGDLPAGARSKVAAFRQVLLSIQKAIGVLPASEAVRFAAEASGMEKMFKDMGEEGRERLLNIGELINVATKYDSAKPSEGIEQLLEEAALQSEQDGLGVSGSPSERPEALSLMTVHASKGLEFEAVFIVGLEQGLFPWTRVDENRDPEEERRLFYVALTRAKKRLFLSYADERMKYGSRDRAIPSEFLSDIDARLIEYARPYTTTYEEKTIR